MTAKVCILFFAFFAVQNSFETLMKAGYLVPPFYL